MVADCRLNLFYFTLLNIIISFINAEKEYILPRIFGNVSTADLESTTSCGAIMATYNSVPAKSNGADQVLVLLVEHIVPGVLSTSA